ncbi:MAG: XdhC family protein [Candidatus Latescibacterota bacterium]|nr:XdhC family protein [Candidatus Latescibacterota bacterium]
MKDLQTIVRRARALDEENAPYVLATVVQTSGSVYRGPGARMLIEADLQSLGTISGGCLEGDVRENASEVFADSTPRLLHYDATNEDDILWGTGLGCSGTVEVLLERLPHRADFHYPTLLYQCALENRRGVLVTVFALTGATNAAPGQHLALDEKGNAGDDIADLQLRKIALAAARESLATLDDTRLPVTPGLTRHYALEQGRASLLIEPLLPPIALYIFGAGYDAVPLAHLAGELGWRVTVADHRPSYADTARFPTAQQVLLARPGHLPDDLSFDTRSVAVAMSHNYLQDQALLTGLIDAPLAYLGVLGPHARTQRLLADLEKEGIAPNDDQLTRLFSPVGLDIGAETAEEIALSILGEIQAVLTSRQGGKLRDHTGPIHDRPQ